MRKFILYAFDMAREIQITPRRISYAREKEAELYDSLMAIASSKQDEIRNLIMDTVAKMKDDLLDKAAAYEFKGTVQGFAKVTQPIGKTCWTLISYPYCRFLMIIMYINRC